MLIELRDTETVIVFDCGSTNIRSAVVDSSGTIIAQASRENKSYPQFGNVSWRVWNIDEIWMKLAESSRKVSSMVGKKKIKAVIVTTWGADGAPVKRDGSLTYPPISWQCTRTIEIANRLKQEASTWEIYKITGYQVISFNTLIKLIWLRKNCPKALEEAYTWLMMPGLIAYRLTGEFHIDPTSASTMMAMDLKRRDWSSQMLELTELTADFFPEWKEPGEILGYVNEKAARQCGLCEGIPVIVGGHDTQFAILGACPGERDAILSSGTWEILSVRSNNFNPTPVGFKNGLIIEADVQQGFWNPQMLMLGSAVLEWIRELLFKELERKDYEAMIKEAENIPPGSDGLIIIPSLVRDSGPTRKYGTLGTIMGLTLQTTRGHIYRAALEGLSFQLKAALDILKEATNIHPEKIKIVGGGSKNMLWNKIRAEVTKLPITIPHQQEATILGAAITAFKGINHYNTFEEAQKEMQPKEKIIESKKKQKLYQNLYKKYIKIPETLKTFYQQKA